ncbi:hypothetical protein FKP32DRAFT_1606082 [Trametes sanguinea]|nr:hypothetical protein FKP32DRAFT_1606082 [Trametes sanguinea]
MPIASSASSMMPLRYTLTPTAKTASSKECQKAHWRKEHKSICSFYAVGRDHAIKISENPRAWTDLVTWTQYHHASLVNAALAGYLRMMIIGKAGPETVTLLFIEMRYLNDPKLPPHRQFELCEARFVTPADPKWTGMCSMASFYRPAAVAMGKREMQHRYWGTGGYLLSVRFRKGPVDLGEDYVPFWKHFGIDQERAHARPACRHPLDQLEENVREGRKIRFCCGKIEGLPTCCCGGWTHDTQSEPEAAKD